MPEHVPGVQDEEDEMLYGFFHLDDPRDFFPDEECCSPQELQAHQAACALAEMGKWRGEPEEHGPWVNDRGAVVIGQKPEGEGWTGQCHAMRSFGIGTYLIHGGLS